MYVGIYALFSLLRYFPCIFGPNEDLPLDKDASYKSFEKLTEDVSIFLVYSNYFQGSFAGKVSVV